MSFLRFPDGQLFSELPIFFAFCKMRCDSKLDIAAQQASIDEAGKNVYNEVS